MSNFNFNKDNKKRPYDNNFGGENYGQDWENDFPDDFDEHWGDDNPDYQEALKHVDEITRRIEQQSSISDIQDSDDAGTKKGDPQGQGDSPKDNDIQKLNSNVADTGESSSPEEEICPKNNQIDLEGDGLAAQYLKNVNRDAGIEFPDPIDQMNVRDQQKKKKQNERDASTNELNYEMHHNAKRLVDNQKKEAVIRGGKDEKIPAVFARYEIRSQDGTYSMISVSNTVMRKFFDVPDGVELPKDVEFRLEKDLGCFDQKGMKINTNDEEINKYLREWYAKHPCGHGTPNPGFAFLVVLGESTKFESKLNKEFIIDTHNEYDDTVKVHGKEQRGLPGFIVRAQLVSYQATEEQQERTGKSRVFAILYFIIPRKPILDPDRHLIGVSKKFYGMDSDATSEKGKAKFIAKAAAMRAIVAKVFRKGEEPVRQMPLLKTGAKDAAIDAHDKLYYSVARELNKFSRKVRDALFDFDHAHEDCKNENYIKEVNGITQIARKGILDIIQEIDFTSEMKDIFLFIKTSYDTLINKVLRKSEEAAKKYDVGLLPLTE